MNILTVGEWVYLAIALAYISAVLYYGRANSIMNSEQRDQARRLNEEPLGDLNSWR